MNHNNIDLNSLWNQQPVTAPPDVQEIFREGNRLKKKRRNKLLFSNCLLLLTVVFVVFIGTNSNFKMLTTKIGIILTAVAILFYVMVSGGIFPLLFKSHAENNSRAYVQELIQIKRKQEFLHKTALTVYFILLSAGLLLYMMEPASKMNITGEISSYGLTISWILFNWFYIRPKTIKKQQTELNNLIDSLEKINYQLFLNE